MNTDQLQATAVDKVIGYLDKVSGSIGTFVGKLADQLGVASAHVYGILIKQEFTSGLIGVGSTVAFFLTLVFSLIMIYIFIPKANEEREFGRSTLMCVVFAIIGVISTLCFFFSLADISDNIQKIANPEFYAIKDVVNYIKQMAGK